MGRCVPTGIQISEAVAVFLVQTNGGEITSKRRRVMIGLAEEIWTGEDCCYDLQAVHAKLCAGNMYAGEYRKSLIVNAKLQPRSYPKGCEIQKLMKEYFYPAYVQVLIDNQQIKNSPEDVAWHLGAFGRCIKPFYFDNLSIFWLIENQVRVRFGLPITASFRPKNAFDKFRQHMRFEVFPGCYQSRL